MKGAGSTMPAPVTRGRSRGRLTILSVDGMHQSDLTWWVRHHPRSALARLVAGGTQYTHASTTFPSDSFPGLVAQFTGGGPGMAVSTRSGPTMMA